MGRNRACKRTETSNQEVITHSSKTMPYINYSGDASREEVPLTLCQWNLIVDALVG